MIQLIQNLGSEIIQLLLDAGATVNERDNYGSTPLLLKSMTEDACLLNSIHIIYC